VTEPMTHIQQTVKTLQSVREGYDALPAEGVGEELRNLVEVVLPLLVLEMELATDTTELVSLTKILHRRVSEQFLTSDGLPRRVRTRVVRDLESLGELLESAGEADLMLEVVDNFGSKLESGLKACVAGIEVQLCAMNVHLAANAASLGQIAAGLGPPADFSLADSVRAIEKTAYDFTLRFLGSPPPNLSQVSPASPAGTTTP
jgi:hypothetical protein